MAAPLTGPINLSGSILVGGQSQLLASASPSRTRFNLINIDPTNDLWWSPLGAAGAYASGSVRIPANGGMISFNGDAPGSTYFVYGASTNQKFTAWSDA